MHTIETKNQFIELRANGLSFDAIAEKINVCKRTLLRWNRDHDAEIRYLRAMELEAQYDKLFLPHEAQADCLAKLHVRIEYEVAHRDIRALETPQLLRAAARVRKEIRDFRKHTVEAFLPPSAQSSTQPPVPEEPSPEPAPNSPAQ